MADVFFNGPAGRIEGKFFQSSDERAPAAIVLHPHPLYGGSMNNKVVYAVYKTLMQSGMSVLRINFRGVGRSQGNFDSGVGELSDAATALDWLQIKTPLAKEFWLAGFSFGSWIALQLIMRRPEVNNFIAVSPPVNKFDFSFLSPCPIPGLIVHGNQDSIVDEASVISLVDKLTKQKNLKVDFRSIDGADHFFRNKINDLEEIIQDYLQNIAKNGSAGQKGPKTKASKKAQLLIS
ncbi:MAG: alpha/beta hydrolase [Rickettsiaceae bacterium]|nr:alpha/beta hydrolase [Rickettsiaceae bacterium]